MNQVIIGLILPVGKRGFEPPRPYGHSALNATCIPVSSLALVLKY